MDICNRSADRSSSKLAPVFQLNVSCWELVVLGLFKLRRLRSPGCLLAREPRLSRNVDSRQLIRDLFFDVDLTEPLVDVKDLSPDRKHSSKRNASLAPSLDIPLLPPQRVDNRSDGFLNCLAVDYSYRAPEPVRTASPSHRMTRRQKQSANSNKKVRRAADRAFKSSQKPPVPVEQTRRPAGAAEAAAPSVWKATNEGDETTSTVPRQPRRAAVAASCKIAAGVLRKEPKRVSPSSGAVNPESAVRRGGAATAAPVLSERKVGGICSACAEVAPGKEVTVFRSDAGLRDHVSTHVRAGVQMPEQFWFDHPSIRLCRACPENSPTVFVSLLRKNVCGECNRKDRAERSQVVQESKSAKIGLLRPSAASTVSVHDLPTLEQLFSRPLPSALRIPAPVRVKWAHRYSRLLSDARYHNDF